jgi:ketosteroid isomerase-like protein
MTDDLIAFVNEVDRCWMERRFDDLASYIAEDVVMVAPGGRHRLKGLKASVDSYREFMSRCQVTRFDTSDHRLTEHGATAVIEYDWDMAWSDQGSDHTARGQEILVLARSALGWRVVWRTQLSA